MEGTAYFRLGMCKVLSNLIDNAIDAMADLPNGKKHLTITLTENLKEYVFPLRTRARRFRPTTSSAFSSRA